MINEHDDDDLIKPSITRRNLLKFVASTGALFTAARPTSAEVAGTRALRFSSAQTDWLPEPEQVPVTEDLARLPDVRLWYWDTGGSGEPIVFLHPATGSGAVWSYQQPVFAKAGYRVIGYSRRGHFRSEPGPSDKPGSGAADLHNLIEFLGIKKFHLVGSAAGGFIVPDYALSHSDRLYSMVIASSLGGVQDADYVKTTARLIPEGFGKMPADFREIGPSYRAANPAGVARWLQLEHEARQGTPPSQTPVNELSWANIGTIRVPTLLLTGDADLYMPPSRVREFAKRLPGAEVAIIAEAGHAAYWEQPDAFNQNLLAFFSKHRVG